MFDRGKLVVYAIAGIVAWGLLTGGLGWWEAHQAAEAERLDRQTGAALRAAARSDRELLSVRARSLRTDSALSRLQRTAALASARADTAQKESASLRGALAGATTAVDSLPVAMRLIASLSMENQALREARVADRLALDTLLGDRDRWRALSERDSAVRDSLRTALRDEHQARDCHWFGVKFLPRCLSRTTTAVVAGAVGIGGGLVLRGLLHEAGPGGKVAYPPL